MRHLHVGKEGMTLSLSQPVTRAEWVSLREFVSTPQSLITFTVP